MIDQTLPSSEEKPQADVPGLGGISIALHKHDDTLRYRILVSKALSQDTLSTSTQVTVLVSPQETTDKVLSERVQPALRNFIAADWVISSLDRREDAAGLERLKMFATARVAFSENFNLAERSRAAGREGISIAEASTNRSASPEKVAQAVKELWFKVIENTREHIAHFNQLTERDWRIGDIEFGSRDRGGEARVMSKGAMRNELEEFFAESDDPLVKQGGERVSLSAQVTLCARPQP